jgi:hypothetical protein
MRKLCEGVLEVLGFSQQFCEHREMGFDRWVWVPVVWIGVLRG